MNYYWHFYCTDVIYCVLIYYFLIIYVFLPSDDFFRPFGDEVYSHGDLQIVLTTGSKTTDFQ